MTNTTWTNSMHLSGSHELFQAMPLPMLQKLQEELKSESQKLYERADQQHNTHLLERLANAIGSR